VIGRRAGLAWRSRPAGPRARPRQAPVQIQARIGLLSVSEHPFIQDFRDRLRELGFVEGRNLVIELPLCPRATPRSCPAWSRSWWQANVALIVASGSTAVEAAAAASRNLPVVFVTSDPIVTGRTLNIARPADSSRACRPCRSNCAKKVALLRDAVPKLARLALSTMAVRAARGNARA
jgi:putative ABC transport system substrate-binding protein